LTGSGAAKCEVIEAAFGNAHDALRDRFETWDEADRQGVAERERNETVFLVDLSLPPQLLDEGLWSRKPRSTDELSVAEERLSNLNFEKEVNGNVIAYRLSRDGRLVLADPRAHGRIRFGVFHSEKAKKGARKEFFDLPDGWTKNLATKFESLLAEACNRLPAKR
jgi:hypothetical protein